MKMQKERMHVRGCVFDAGVCIDWVGSVFLCPAAFAFVFLLCLCFLALHLFLHVLVVAAAWIVVVHCTCTVCCCAHNVPLACLVVFAAVVCAALCAMSLAMKAHRRLQRH